MSTIEENETVIQAGRLLMRGARNAEPCGVRGTMKDEGLVAGIDLLYSKNRRSGLWESQTLLGCGCRRPG